MNEFLTNLQKQASENPVLALGVAAAVLTGFSKLIEATGNATGSRAYARDVERRIKKQNAGK